MNLDIHVIREKSLTVLVTSFFVLFVVMLPRYTDTAKTWFVLLCLTALGYLVLNFKLVRDTSFLERMFIAAIIFNFLWIAFSFYANGEPGRGASFVWGRHFYFLFLIPLFFMFRKVEIPDRIIILALLASVSVSLIDILIDLFQGIDHRLQGMNPNAFGPIQLCLSGILFFYYIKKPVRLPRWLIMVGIIAGLATIIFSKSRNTWMTFVVLSVFFIFYLARSQSIWKRIAVVTGILLLLSSSYLLPIVKVRIDSTIKDVSLYVDGDHLRKGGRLESIGERIEIWKAGWKVFLDNPVLGVGVGGFNLAARANAERYQINEVVFKYRYFHNQYIAALTTRGIPGLVLFLLVICLPIYIAMSQKGFERESEVSQLAVILVCMTYIIGCFAEDHFEGKSATMFVAVLLALLLARISAGRLKQDSDSQL